MIFKEGTLRVMRTVVHKAFAAKVVALKAVAAKSWLNVASVFGARNIRVASLAGLAVFGGVALSAAHLFATEDIHSSGANDKTQTKVQAGQQPKASQQTKPGGETVIPSSTRQKLAPRHAIWRRCSRRCFPKSQCKMRSRTSLA